MPASAQQRGARSVAPPPTPLPAESTLDDVQPPSPPAESTLDSIPPPLLTAIQQTRLQASDAAASDNFGISVALSADGNTAIVGAYFDDNGGGTNASSAYTFVVIPPTQPGQLIISELRTSGPAVPAMTSSNSTTTPTPP